MGRALGVMSVLHGSLCGRSQNSRAASRSEFNNELFARIYGCEAAGNIANSMGDVTEGLSWQEIEKRYGFVDKLLPQDKKASRSPQQFGPDWVRYAHHRPPGMTEDGFERHRLCTSAILKKGGRITVEDLARTWIADIDPGKFGYLLGPQDQVIYNLLKDGLPPAEVGRYAAWPGFIGTSKMIMPVGIVNACRPDDAARDALQLGRIKDVQGTARQLCSRSVCGHRGGYGRGPAAEGDGGVCAQRRVGATVVRASQGGAAGSGLGEEGERLEGPATPVRGAL